VLGFCYLVEPPVCCGWHIAKETDNDDQKDINLDSDQKMTQHHESIPKPLVGFKFDDGS
jgi:hypothetical protein